MFDVCNKDSFERLVEDFIEVYGTGYWKHKGFFYIIGNKADKEENRQVTEDEVKAFAETYGFTYFETSAKSGLNVDKVF